MIIFIFIFGGNAAPTITGYADHFFTVQIYHCKYMIGIVIKPCGFIVLYFSKLVMFRTQPGIPTTQVFSIE